MNEISKDITTNDRLDAAKLASKLQNLNEKLNDLKDKASAAKLLNPTKDKGVWIFKTESINPEKIQEIGDVVYDQALVNRELFDIQIQAMQLAMGSYKATEMVAQELSSVIEKGFKDSSGNNSYLFDKTQEQILRVATFAKKYADNLKELEENFESKLNSLENSFEGKLSDFVKVEKVNEIENKLSQVQKDFESSKKEFVTLKEIENVKNEISEQDEKFKTTEKNISSIKDELNETLQKIESEKTNIENKIEKNQNEIKSLYNNNEKNLAEQMGTIKNEITSIKDEFAEKINSLEVEVRKKLLDKKLKVVSTISLIFGVIGLAISIFVLVKIL